MTIGASFLFLTQLAAATSPPGSPPPVDFERDISPILAKHCLACHGPGKKKAGLGLHERAQATAVLESGAQAIVAGQPQTSALLARVAHKDPDERMPPEGPALSRRAIALLRAWIAAGAVWPEHWAYRPLRKPEPPLFADPAHEAWVKTPIDRFILRTLLDRGLQPSGPTDRRILLRRITFDLTGLPPTPEQTAAFVTDQDDGAYERVVDRLLASPRYGERWARHWMDVVHFAESHGHDQDRPRENAWPYRDYLIRSFNEDKPYARFVTEQIAGDVLYPDDPWATVATGFLAAGPWDESSLRDVQAESIDRQVGRNLDRDDVVATVASTFVSTTVQCARCHDHKFDPVPQREYYGLQAVFAGVDKANRPYDPDPKLAAQRRALRERIKRGGTVTAAEVADWQKRNGVGGIRWRPLADLVEVTSAKGATLTVEGDGSILSSGTRPERDSYTVSVRSAGKLTAIRLDVLDHVGLPLRGPGRADNGNLHLSEVLLSADGQPVALGQPAADFDQAGWEAPLALDSDPTTAWGIHPEQGASHHIIFPLETPIEGAKLLKLELKQEHGGGHLIGRFRLSAADAALPVRPDPPIKMMRALALPAATRSIAQQQELAAFVYRKNAERDLEALPPETLVYTGTPTFRPDGSFFPAGRPRAVFVLHRGEIQSPTTEVQPGALSLMPTTFALGDQRNEGARRAAFASWVADPQTSLTWRSIVNRLWQHHFGRGLVDTANDFGRMGAAPTHPELLDWLAATLLEQGGSLKALHRLMVTSAVYRQTTDHVRRFAVLDADNHTLWRMNRRRLDAESVRDAILQMSGKLDLTMGGPSVRQFKQKPGVHVTPEVDYFSFEVDAPENWRRSIYRFLFRTSADPFMEALDCPDSSQSSPKRDVSLSALQALAMLNDKLIIRHSEHVAGRIAGLKQPLAQLYRLVFARPPTAKESKIVGVYAAKHGFHNAARFLFNSNEFMFLD